MEGNKLLKKQAGQLIGSGLEPEPHKVKKSVRVATHFAVLSCLAFSPYVYAAPSGGHIVSGTGSINTQGLTTNIHQNTQSLAINWNSFDVKHNETVNFLQPNASSIALNRILGNNASQIFGQINANR